MKKLLLSFIAVLLVTGTAFAGYKITSKQKPSQPMDEYSTVIINNFSIVPSQWKNLGYDSPAGWKKEADSAKEYLVSYLSKKLPRKKIKFGKTGGSQGIKVAVVVSELHNTYGFGGFKTYLMADVTFTDLGKQKVIYSAKVQAKGSKSMNLAKRMKAVMKSLGDFFKDTLK